MDCRHVKKLLDDYFDKTLSSREQDSVEEHLISCAKCREEYTRMERLIAFLRDTASPDALPPPDFFNGVLRAPMKSGARERFRRRLRRLGGVCATFSTPLWADRLFCVWLSLLRLCYSGLSSPRAFSNKRSVHWLT